MLVGSSLLVTVHYMFQTLFKFCFCFGFPIFQLKICSKKCFVGSTFYICSLSVNFNRRTKKTKISETKRNMTWRTHLIETMTTLHASPLTFAYPSAEGTDVGVDAWRLPVATSDSDRDDSVLNPRAISVARERSAGVAL